MKVIMVDKKGNETLVCESIDQFHGSLVVSLLNGNYATKHREVNYKLVDLSHELKCVNKDQIELPFDDLTM